jgi:LPS O-antigen subunit length determinant protein (WzzB/FepE family)
LLRDLKNKDLQIREKDSNFSIYSEAITTLETKCKTLSFTCQESSTFKQQNNEIKAENSNLQKAIAELEDSYAFLHGQFRSKEAVTCQKYDEMEGLNDQLMNKLRSLTKRYQEREEEFDFKYSTIVHNF